MSLAYRNWGIVMGNRTRVILLVFLGVALVLLGVGCSTGGNTPELSDSADDAAAAGQDPLTVDGWGAIKIGTSESAVTDVLGEPDAQQEYPAMGGRPAVVFYDYVDAGIQVGFVKPQMTVNALFCFAGTGDHADFARFAAGTDQGITWASKPEDVIAAYGKPINGYMSDDGGREWRRLAYRDMSFRFQNDVLETIAIGAD